MKQEGEDEKDGGGEEEEEEEEDGEKKKKTGKSYDYATKLNYLFREARYFFVWTEDWELRLYNVSRFFLVKSNNAENVSLAKSKAVWSTPPQNESKFNQVRRSKYLPS